MRVILVDGTCVFCNRLVAFILRRDKNASFHFSHIQSAFAQGLFSRHASVTPSIDNIYLVEDANAEGESVYVDGQAGRRIWPQLFWVAGILRFTPLAVVNLWYHLFARVRYRLFGKYDQCLLPSAEQRMRFLP